MQMKQRTKKTEVTSNRVNGYNLAEKRRNG